MTIKIIPNDSSQRGMPAGKLADAELHFTEGPLEGLKLIGFAIWAKRAAAGGYNVTYPARQYNINGERRSFALLRPMDVYGIGGQERLRDAIIAAYEEHERARLQADENAKLYLGDK